MSDLTEAVEAAMPGAERTLQALQDAVLADLDDAYDLVYVDYRDKFSDEQVAMIVRDDWGALWDSTMEWESDQRYEHARELMGEAVRRTIERWEREDGADYTDLCDEFLDDLNWYQPIIDAITDLDRSDWVSELASHSGDVLLRLCLVNEDQALYGDDAKPREFLKTCGLPLTRNNYAKAREALAERGTGLAMVYVLAAVPVSDLIRLGGEDVRVAFTGFHLYVGNPFTGAAYVAGPFDGTVTFDRGDLRTDRDAFGYGWDEIAGIASVSYYSATMKEVA